MKFKNFLFLISFLFPISIKTAEKKESKTESLSDTPEKLKNTCPWFLLNRYIVENNKVNFDYLIEKNPDLLNYQGKPFGVTPLMIACAEGKKDIVKQLIDLKAQLDLTSDLKENALIIAAKRNYPVIVELLLNANANPLDESGKFFYEYVEDPKLNKKFYKITEDILTKKFNLE